MLKNEVIISELDKESAFYHIAMANAILNKYPYESCPGNTVTHMSRAKNAVKEALACIEYLYISEEFRR